MTHYSAGTCEKCGWGKIWEKKVKNPKSEKLMPAHVDDDGALLNNDGYCGAYSEPKNIKANFKPNAVTGTIFAPKPAAAPVAQKPAASTISGVYDEILIMLDNITSNVMTIKAKLAGMQKP
jgi:hypothetical protein